MESLELQFLLPLAWRDRRERMSFAIEHGLGLEIHALASGHGLNDDAAREKMERALEEELLGFTGPVSLHGAFLDLAIHSPDSQVAALSRARMERDLATATRLGAGKVVFHLGFNPLVPVDAYFGEVFRAHREFWPAMLEAYPGITVCLENLWEPDWTLLEAVVEEVAHPRLRLCLDVAHAHVSGQRPPHVWIRQLGRWITHLHWNDSLGDRDSHLPLGQGTIDWAKVVQASHRLRHDTTVVLELSSLTAVQQSLTTLADLGVRPLLPEARTSASV